MAFDIKRATEFVTSVDLSGTRRGIVPQDATIEVEVFDKAKSQAQVVGAGVFYFAQGVTAEVREAISDSALLAQLVANKKVSAAEERPLDWFAAYSDVLQNLGWTLQEAGWADYTAKGTAVEVHQKILEVMTVALGPAP